MRLVALSLLVLWTLALAGCQSKAAKVKQLQDQYNAEYPAYAKDCLDLLKETDTRALAHITGGGIPGNLVRVLPEHVDAVVDRSTWRPQSVFDLVQSKGRIDQQEMESTFNMGIGMMAVVAPHDVERTLAFLRGRSTDAWLVGEMISGSGQVQMVGSYTRG